MYPSCLMSFSVDTEDVVMLWSSQLGFKTTRKYQGVDILYMGIWPINILILF